MGKGQPIGMAATRKEGSFPLEIPMERKHTSEKGASSERAEGSFSLGKALFSLKELPV